jgi:hypothetical protein
MATTNTPDAIKHQHIKASTSTSAIHATTMDASVQHMARRLRVEQQLETPCLEFVRIDAE